MIETVDDLILALSKHKGKNVMIKDLLKLTTSHILDITEENGCCVIEKSVRDYPTNP